MAVPYTFAGDTGSIPLSQLDSNFATPITIGSTPVALGSTATTVSGLSLNSPTLTTPVLGTPTSGTLTNCTGLPNSGLVNASITLGNTSASLGSTVATINGLNLTNTSLTSPSLTSPTLTTPVLGTPSSGNLANCTFPTLNQSTTGTASNVTGTVAIANGGTGQTTQQAALTALSGTQTSGQYLRSNGTNTLLSAIQTADVPTLNQSTTGTASNVTGTVAIANGGTGQTTQQSAFNALAPSQTSNSGKYLTTNGTNTSWASIVGITSSTAVATTSGTSVDFTSIPSSVKRITILFNGVSTSGTSLPIIQIGDAVSGFASSGYFSNVGFAGTLGGAGSNSAVTAGFLCGRALASDNIYGAAVLTLITTNSWIYTLTGAAGSSTNYSSATGAGNKSIANTLDRVRITTVNGTDSFDAGSINILYE